MMRLTHCNRVYRPIRLYHAVHIYTLKNSLMIISRSENHDKRLLALELATLFVLTVLTLWSVRPLLEEWGLLNVIKSQGLGYIKAFAQATPMRPLHLLPIALNWELGQGRPVGVAASTALMMIIRYGIARWAVSPVLQGYDRWVVAALAAVLVAWPGAWLGRFGAGQLSLIAFFAAVGFAIRLSQRWSIRSAIGCVASIWFMLSVYQALALCLIALPLFSLLWSKDADPAYRWPLARQRFIRIAVTVATGFLVYAIVAFVASRAMGGGGYEATLAQGSSKLMTVSGIANHVTRAYAAAYGRDTTLAFLLLLALCMLGPLLTRDGKGKTAWTAPALAVCLVLALPLFSLIYVNELHIGDPDRVTFPVATGFVLASLSLLARYCPPAGKVLPVRQASLIVAVLLVSSVVASVNVKKYADLQKTVLIQTVAAIGAQQPKSLLLHDATGRLGDVYTFLNPLFTEALAVYGRNVTTIICTPTGIDRIHPDAQRYPIGTTPRCEEVAPMPAPVLVLTVRNENGTITVRP